MMKLGARGWRFGIRGPALGVLVLLCSAALGAGRFAQSVTHDRSHVSPAGTALRLLVDEQTLGGQEVELGEITFPAGADSGDHQHGVTEIFYVLSGELEHIVNGKSYLLKPGMTGYVRPPDKVRHKVSSAGPARALVIWAPGGEAARVTGRWRQAPPGSAAPSRPVDSVFLEELTWMEARDAIKAGKTTIIFPTGGTEQNGPHMVLGKHNFIIRHASELIARRLGNALVAPVLAYVPEGNIDPPSGHMRYAGAITLPNEHFMKVAEYAARSFKVHGFTDIVLLGDSGGNQNGLKAVAETLNKEWAATPVRVHFVGDYYSGTGFGEWLAAQGEKKEEIGTHAGITDTSQLMAVDARQIRMDRRAPGGGFEGSGVSGNPARASVEYGKKGIELKVEAAVRQIGRLMIASRQ